MKYLIQYTIIFISIVFSQSYFDRIIGGDVQTADARSLALANTLVSTGSSSSIVSKNPARLSYLASGSKGFILDFQFNGISINERRSTIILDMFGDYLNESDYVSNRNNYFNHSLGFIISKKINNNSNYGFGISYMPLASFNYKYKEEVRFDADPDIGSNDPLLGFHTYENKGELNILSVGLGYSKKIKSSKFSMGFSKNYIYDSVFRDQIHIDTLFYDSDIDVYSNLSDVKNIDNKYKTNSKEFETFSIEIPISYGLNSAIIFSAESKAFIKSENYSNDESVLPWNISDESQLPWFLDQFLSGYDDSIPLNFTLSEFVYYKPKIYTYGLRINKYRTLLVFENVHKMYGNVFGNIFNDSIKEYKIAFEYRFKFGSSLRLGLLYKEPIMKSFKPITQLTLGSNKVITKKFNIDFALSYFSTNYEYEDIFPVVSPSNENGGCANFCSKVTESKTAISTTFKWSF